MTDAHNPPEQSLDPIYLVRDAARLAILDPELSPGREATAAGICKVMLELSVDQFGAEGKEVLTEWGIQTSQDVGVIVHRLLDADLLEAKHYTRMGSFAGLFDLQQPPESWTLTW
ncbi:hypothetical protein [Stieleria varia]|uniref:Uncharacterized protein n=1 Tax=Stieleria varia TaxID=2528005 RepID=A0A5C6ANZ9_9BACT|nr:hypothetical protein [Stieleria varia]TWU01237.1 hypothetical protein Pla52n_46100 [Stieleria varia]